MKFSASGSSRLGRNQVAGKGLVGEGVANGAGLSEKSPRSCSAVG